MKKKWKWILGAVVLAYALLVVCMRWDDIVKKPLVPEAEHYVLAKQWDDYGEYVITDDFGYISMWHDYFADKELLTAKYVSLRPWKYKLILTPTVVSGFSTSGFVFYNHDKACIMYIYEDCLEIDGITYYFREESEQSDMLDFFDGMWSDLTHLYQGVPTGKVYPGVPQDDYMPVWGVATDGTAEP